ncbi:actin-like ATPase domain-containing protein [Tothia fuscella]|uniref:Phosphotransferase n=1 Tax=Tothia fuscella TaxID=1048955 RepID=A0A9P4NPY0_9PEZI|nr:actin-like ATPase domain-containing protein [Tothia fuscella]
MVPSLINTVLPSIRSSKRIHRDALQPHKSKMDDFLRDLTRQFEAPIRSSNMLAMSNKLQAQFKQNLACSDISMLPSYNHTLPTGEERGTYLALDVGGSTFRVALVFLNGRSRHRDGMQIKKMLSYRIDARVKALSGHDFFDWIAERICETLEDPEVRISHDSSVIAMGLAWSFPVEQTSVRGATLLDMGKGFCATKGVLGQDIRDLIMRACRKKNLNVRLDAVVNDGTATLLTRAYEDEATRLALILGTGTNMAVVLPVSALAHSKYGKRPQSWHDQAKQVLVNTELSMFGKNILPTTRWDDYLNVTHVAPDFQPLEYLISGRYLGEITRLILLEAIQTKALFGGQLPDHFLEPYAFDTGIMAAIEEDDSPHLSKGAAAFQKYHPLRIPPSVPDLHYVRQVCQLVSRRAAAYLATGIHALWFLRTEAENLVPSTADTVSIGCNGSVIERYPAFRSTCQSFLDDLVELSGGNRNSVILEVAYESAIFGAAVAVCCLEGQ